MTCDPEVDIGFGSSRGGTGVCGAGRLWRDSERGLHGPRRSWTAPEAAGPWTRAPTETPTERAGTEPDEDEPETLADCPGGDFNDPEAAAARAMEDERRVQELIAGCMAQEGFEYIPAVRPSASSRLAFDQEEYAREQGFGITTGFGRETSLLVEEQDDGEDPNRAMGDYRPS